MPHYGKRDGVPSPPPGTKFHRFTVIEELPRCVNEPRFIRCVCVCGTERIVWLHNLRNGHSKSCGCLSIEALKARLTTHGEGTKVGKSPEFRTWSALKGRCSARKVREKDKVDYYSGIEVCERWLNSFENFLADMGRKPSKEHSIDRIDNSLGYCPENCRWATKKEQARNRSSVRPITYKGETKLFVDWCEALGIPEKVLWKRLKRGWSVEDAFTRPIRGRDK